MVYIICGHYGSGKTNLCLNLALEEVQNKNKVMIVDMDVVNPYFRSSDYINFLTENNIELVAPEFAGTTLDIPTISPAVHSAFIQNDKTVFIDLGGDDAGATSIAQFRDEIKEYEMLYVINKSRNLTQNPAEAVEILREIENASKLKATAIVNNTNLGVETTTETIKSSVEFANDVAKLANLPLKYTTAVDFAGENDFKKIKRLVKFPWE